MKNKIILLALYWMCLGLVACDDENNPVASDNLGIVEMFGPGENADQEVKDVFSQYGIWIRTHFDYIDQLTNAIIYEDANVKNLGATNMDASLVSQPYAYVKTLLGNVSEEFIKTYFPLEFFFVGTYGSRYWTYDFAEVGRSRLVVCWPNQAEGCIEVTDPENHYYQDSVLTVNVWSYLSGMITKRMEDDLLLEFGAAGRAYDGGAASGKILDDYYEDYDSEKYEKAMEELAFTGGFLTGGGSASFQKDFADWIALLATESYVNIKKEYLDNSKARTQKYEIFVKFMKEQYDWDIQAVGNKFRQKFDEYKATLPPPVDEGDDEE